MASPLGRRDIIPHVRRPARRPGVARARRGRCSRAPALPFFRPRRSGGVPGAGNATLVPRHRRGACEPARPAAPAGRDHRSGPCLRRRSGPPTSDRARSRCPHGRRARGARPVRLARWFAPRLRPRTFDPRGSASIRGVLPSGFGLSGHAGRGHQRGPPSPGLRARERAERACPSGFPPLSWRPVADSPPCEPEHSPGRQHCPASGPRAYPGASYRGRPNASRSVSNGRRLDPRAWHRSRHAGTSPRAHPRALTLLFVPVLYQVDPGS